MNCTPPTTTTTPNTILTLLLLLSERCPSGDDPYTTVDETNCQGISQQPGTDCITLLLLLYFYCYYSIYCIAL